MDYTSFLTGAYEQQLGRAPDEGGMTYWAEQLANGVTPEQVMAALNTSVEGQNFDTQLITSEYRQQLGRNPEQEGFQYWLSTAQATGATPQQIESWLGMGVTAPWDVQAYQYGQDIGGYTNLQLPSFESDPYGGRYTNVSRYIADPSQYPNVSYIGEKGYQFMSPITQQPVISKYAPETWEAQIGLDVLSSKQVDAAIDLAFKAGTIDQKDYESLYEDLARAKSMDDVYAAFNKPQAQVVIDALYGFQSGEGKTLEEAQKEAAVREPYIQQFGYYPSNFAVADLLAKAGIDYPFTYENMQKMGALYSFEDVVTPENFKDKIGGVLNMSFGGANFVNTPLGSQYYSERGLEPGFTPFEQGPTFRSGVAGYTTELPTGFQFGVVPVRAPIQAGPQSFQVGKFDQNATGYDQYGNPIFGGAAQQTAPSGSYLNNPVIGYTADGKPIYSSNTPSESNNQA